MEVLNALSNLRRKWRRRKTDDARQWLEVWEAAYVLAYSVLGDSIDSRDVADKALLSFKGKRQNYKHRGNNQDHYSKVRGGDNRIRRIQLPDHLKLAGQVFHHSTEKEKGIAARGEATVVDLDIWYIKRNIQHVIQCSNALSAAVSVCRGIHDYGPDELSATWFELVGLAPRRRESWDDGNEPFDKYWRKLKRAINERFKGLISIDASGNIVRRPQQQQPRDLVARYVREFTLQAGDEPCVTTAADNGAKPATDDRGVEELRLYTFIRLPCYTELVKLVRRNRDITLPEDNLGLPQYKNIMSSNKRAALRRTAPPLTEEEREWKRKDLEQLAALRKRATAELVVAVDGAEQVEAGAALRDTGRARFRAHENSQAVEVWARVAGGRNVFLTSYLLSEAGGTEVALLEGGQRLFFLVNYDGDDSGGGTYSIIMRYQETKRARRKALAQMRQRAGEPERGRARTPFERFAPTLAYVVMIALLAAAVVAVVMNRLQNNPLEPATPQTTHSGGVQNPAHSPDANSNIAAAKSAPDAGSTGESNTSGEPDGGGGEQSVAEDRAARSEFPRRSIRQNTMGGSRGDVANQNRGGTGGEQIGKTVAPVRRIYVERPDIFERDDLNLRLHAAALETLNGTGQFQVVDDPALAQARLVVVSGHRTVLGEKVRPQLFTAAGEKLIWNGPLISLFDEDDPEGAIQKAEDVGRRIGDALIKKKQSERSPGRR
jgi:hypothetical protein